VRRGELEAGDACDDEDEAGEAEGGAWFVEAEHADEGGACCADASPDGVGGAEGDGAEGEGEEGEAGGHGGEGGGANERFGEAVGEFEADGPADFEDAGDDEVGPGHGVGRLGLREVGREGCGGGKGRERGAGFLFEGPFAVGGADAEEVRVAVEHERGGEEIVEGAAVPCGERRAVGVVDPVHEPWGDVAG